MQKKTNLHKAFLTAAVIILFISLVSSCEKETVVETVIKKDSIIIRHDSIIVKEDVAKILPKKWLFTGHEIEYYSGTSMTSKKTESFTASGFYTEFKTGGLYTNNDLGGVTNGTWQLLSANYYVLDKGAPNERYYYILSISENNLITRGPFNKNNGLASNFLFTGYYQKQ